MAYKDSNGGRFSSAADHAARTAEMFARQGGNALDKGFDAEDTDESITHFREAVSHFQSALSVSTSLAVYHDMGLAHFCIGKRSGDLQQQQEHMLAAVGSLRKALGIQSQDRSTQDLLARALFDLSESADAEAKINYLDEAISLMEPVVAERLLQAEQLDETDEAALASTCHRFALYNVNRGLASDEADRYKFFTPAVEYFRRAYELANDNMHFWYCYGNSLMDKGKATADTSEQKELFAESLQLHETAMKIIDENEEVYGKDGPGFWIASEFKYNYACILCLNGRSSESLELLRLAISKYGYDKGFAARDKDFAAINGTPEFQAIIS